MIRAELIRSCSNPAIADAALRSIGCDFRRQVNRAAQRRGLRAGVLVAHLVDMFGESASEEQWTELRRRMAGADMPVLAGLRFIVETMAPDCGAVLEPWSSAVTDARGLDVACHA